VTFSAHPGRQLRSQGYHNLLTVFGTHACQDFDVNASSDAPKHQCQFVIYGGRSSLTSRFDQFPNLSQETLWNQ